jgi:hypothetical protein
MNIPRGVKRSLLLAVALVLVLALQHFMEPGGETPFTTVEQPATSGDQAIRELYEKKRSGAMVESSGVIDKILADDHEGSRHQRFVVRLRNGETLLFAHNIDLAPRVPLREGDEVHFRGQYEWNERGGLIHWTHDDPHRERMGGWIRHDGEDYR